LRNWAAQNSLRPDSGDMSGVFGGNRGL